MPHKCSWQFLEAIQARSDLLGALLVLNIEIDVYTFIFMSLLTKSAFHQCKQNRTGDGQFHT